MTRKARGDGPGLRLVSGTIELPGFVGRLQQFGRPQAGLAPAGLARWLLNQSPSDGGASGVNRRGAEHARIRTGLGVPGKADAGAG